MRLYRANGQESVSYDIIKQGIYCGYIVEGMIVRSEKDSVNFLGGSKGEPVSGLGFRDVDLA